MRFIFFTYSIFFIVFVGSIYIVTHTQSYEQSIIGRWEEVSWEFEKADQPTKDSILIDGSQKAEICKNLTIHEAEMWEFKPGREISLYNNTQQPIQNLEWTIKGRGNILEIRHPNHQVENYRIQELQNDTMIIHFNFDLQVRGIVKMTFKRIQPEPKTEYAAKIP
jgi:hypothetical protein